MADIKKHQRLIDLDTLVKDILINHTKNANNNGFKHIFSHSFSFGKNKIEKENGLISKRYYIFKVILTDKTNAIEKELVLYSKVYPENPLRNSNKLNEDALLDFIGNAIGGLIAIEFTKYNARQMQEQVNKELEEITKPKLIIER